MERTSCTSLPSKGIDVGPFSALVGEVNSFVFYWMDKHPLCLVRSCRMVIVNDSWTQGRVMFPLRPLDRY
jgi:hypothetical protein